jgi:hypothetical protein
LGRKKYNWVKLLLGQIFFFLKWHFIDGSGARERTWRSTIGELRYFRRPTNINKTNYSYKPKGMPAAAGGAGWL